MTVAHSNTNAMAPMRQRAANDAKISQVDERFVLGVKRMKMRRRMIPGYVSQN
jgi:hypothetical protein